MPRTPSRLAKAAKPRSRVGQNLAISVAMLEQQAEQTTSQFAVLGDKFDRIIERVEQLTLNTTTLISRHDTQIQVLQKQLVSAEETMRETKDTINETSNHVAGNLSKQISEAMHEMSEALDKMSEKMTTQNEVFDKRLRALERWRWMVMGAGIMLGAIFAQALDLAGLFYPH